MRRLARLPAYWAVILGLLVVPGTPELLDLSLRLLAPTSSVAPFSTVPRYGSAASAATEIQAASATLEIRYRAQQLLKGGQGVRLFRAKTVTNA